jgi:hypothetical protein
MVLRYGEGNPPKVEVGEFSKRMVLCWPSHQKSGWSGIILISRHTSRYLDAIKKRR